MYEQFLSTEVKRDPLQPRETHSHRIHPSQRVQILFNFSLSFAFFCHQRIPEEYDQTLYEIKFSLLNKKWPNSECLHEEPLTSETKYQTQATLGRRHLFWVEVSGDTVHHEAGEGMAPGFHFQQGEHESAAIYIFAAAEEAERRSRNGLKPSAM